MANAELQKLLEQNRKKWKKAEQVKKALIKEHGELIGLIMYRKYLDTI